MNKFTVEIFEADSKPVARLMSATNYDTGRGVPMSAPEWREVLDRILPECNSIKDDLEGMTGRFSAFGRHRDGCSE